MPPKRKSDVLEPVIDLTAEQPEKENGAVASLASAGSAAKKARVSDVGEASSTASGKKGQAALSSAPKNWREIVLEGEDEVSIHIRVASCPPRLKCCCVFLREKCLYSKSRLLLACIMP